MEKGLLNLDDDISTVVPEWKERQVLLGFDEASGKPVLREATGKITVGMLLTHQSGMGYPFMLPDLERYSAYQKSEGLVISELVVCIPYIPARQRMVPDKINSAA